jgi:hypothetical protein
MDNGIRKGNKKERCSSVSKSVSEFFKCCINAWHTLSLSLGS